jgi:hypothetical protein
MGGVLVYGIVAKKNADGVDCATMCQPIAEIEFFQSEVIRACGQLLMPKHDGIRVEIIRTTEDNTQGYLAIYIERSERRPHRSEARNDKQYYKRAGESTFAMEHYDIEDAFRRFSVAHIELERKIYQGGHMFHGDGTGIFLVIVEVSLRNTANLTARFPYLHLLRSGTFEFRGIGPHGGPGLPLRTEPDWDCFEGGADHVINPGVSRPITRISFQLQRLRHDNAPDLASLQPIAIEYRCGCEHSPLTTGSVQITVDDLRSLLQMPSE